MKRILMEHECIVLGLYCGFERTLGVWWYDGNIPEPIMFLFKSNMISKKVNLGRYKDPETSRENYFKYIGAFND